MSNILRKTTELAMFIVSKYAFEGSVIIDATCGNGHDTLTLAKTKPSKLYAFDIQQQAVDATASLLVSEGYCDKIENGTINIICDSHSNMQSYVKERPNIIVFNLGYLPGGDKHNTTTEATTLDAISASLEMLAINGILCITMYSGHQEGLIEKTSLLDMASKLDSGTYHVAYTGFINQHNSPPELLMITKKK